MRWLWFSCLLLASLLPLSAEDWTTADGKTYKNVSVVAQEDDGVRITYDGGVGKIPYYELPVDVQKRFGQDVESLALKKRAVDKAIEDAVRNAAEAQIIKQPSAPGSPGVAPQPLPPGVSAPGANSSGPGGVTAVTPNGTTPGGISMPGASPGGPPGNSATATSSGGGASGSAGGVGPGASTANSAATNAAPGAQKSGSPSTATAANPGAHGAIPGGPANAGPNGSLPGLDLPPSRTPEPAGISAAGGKPLQLMVANYSYNSALDVCYLDSPAIDVSTEADARTPLPPGQGSSLTFRIVTDGATPQIPERFEVTFLSVGENTGDLGSSTIVFSTETGPVTVTDSDRKDSGALPGGGRPVQYASFYLQSAEVHQICNGKPVVFNVGANQYHIDARGAAILKTYLADVDSLEPATSSLVHSFYKMLSRIPSFFSIISTVCEYIILGSFALLVAASIAAFILGVTRFIKM